MVLFSVFLLMVTVSEVSLRISSEICLALTTISPLSVISASMVLEIAIFKSMPCTINLLSRVSK